MLPRRTILALLVASLAPTLAPAQLPPPRVPREKIQAQVARLIGGSDRTHYIIVFVEGKPDQLRSAAKGVAMVGDVLSLPIQGLLLLGGAKTPPFWMSRATEAVVGPTRPPEFDVEVAVLHGRKEAAEAVTTFVTAPPDGKARAWTLVKRAADRTAAVKAADAQEAQLQRQARAGARLAVNRRPDPAAKK